MFPKHPRNHQFGIDDHQFEFTVTFLHKKGSKSINSHIDAINLSTLMTSIYLLTTHPVRAAHACTHGATIQADVAFSVPLLQQSLLSAILVRFDLAAMQLCQF